MRKGGSDVMTPYCVVQPPVVQVEPKAFSSFARCSHPPPPPADPESPVVILVRLQRAGKLLAVLWSFASICESCRRAQGEEAEGGEGGHRCFRRASVCAAVRRNPRANRSAWPPAAQQGSRPDFRGAGTDPLAPPTPPLPLPQLAGCWRVGPSS